MLNIKKIMKLFTVSAMVVVMLSSQYLPIYASGYVGASPKGIDGYGFTEAVGGIRGLYEEASQGVVTVEHVDEYGAELVSPTVISGSVGEFYETTARNIDGRVLHDVLGSAIGRYTKEPITVIYIYGLSDAEPSNEPDNDDTMIDDSDEQLKDGIDIDDVEGSDDVIHDGDDTPIDDSVESDVEDEDYDDVELPIRSDDASEQDDPDNIVTPEEPEVDEGSNDTDTPIDDSIENDDTDTPIDNSIENDDTDTPIDDSIENDDADTPIDDGVENDDTDTPIDDSIENDDTNTPIDDSIENDDTDTPIDDSIENDNENTTQENENDTESPSIEQPVKGEDVPEQDDTDKLVTPEELEVDKKSDDVITNRVEKGSNDNNGTKEGNAPANTTGEQSGQKETIPQAGAQTNKLAIGMGIVFLVVAASIIVFGRKEKQI